MSHMPSLQTLRAFEAAGRLKSYSKAAEELGLTHGAVSHRIRELEQRLGFPLFKRVGNTMQLTPEGQKLEAQVRQGLSLLEQAFAHPMPTKERAHIVLASVPSMASTWLFERLAEFRACCPEIDIDLRVSERLMDYKKEGVDLGVRLGLGGWQGLNAVKLFDEVMTPVCTPDYRDQFALKTPADLARATLLRNPWTPWARWFRAVGLDWPEPKRGPVFDDGALLLRAAVQGGGVALGRRWLAADELRAGRLVAPFAQDIQDEFSYWLVWPTGRASKEAEHFRGWLEAQAKAEHAPPAVQETQS